VGPYYKALIEYTRDCVTHLDTEFPEWKGMGYRIAGIGWHQGWNDRIDQAFNDEYEKNLANFIRDIRKDLGTPNLPFVIAETGMSGPEEKHPRALSLMKAQAAVAEYPEFQGNVAFVGTKAFWRDKEASPTGQAYHWNTNAETYYLIGEAMGQAMKRICSKCLRNEKLSFIHARLTNVEPAPCDRRDPACVAHRASRHFGRCQGTAEGRDGRLSARPTRQGRREIQCRLLDVRGRMAALEELSRAGVSERPVRHLDVFAVRWDQA